MATERHSRQHDEQRGATPPTTESPGEDTQRAVGRGGKQGGQATDVQRSQGEYQRGRSMPSLYSAFGEGPFAMMRRLTDEMDRLFEGFGVGRGVFPSLGRGFGSELQSLWSPHIEMAERGDKLIVSVDLPGVKREDVNVEIGEGAITIQGERRQESTTNERGYYRSERSYGSFHRQVPLPDGVNADSASATFRDGVLEIEMDAPTRQHGRRLEIKEKDVTGGTPGTH